MILDMLPSGWVRVRLGDICSQALKVHPTKLGRESFQYIDIGSVDSSSFSVTSPELIQVEAAPSRARQVVRVGDTLFSTVRPYLRKIAYVGPELDGEIASTGFCVIRPAADIEPRFIFHLATSDWFINIVTAQQYGASYPAVRDEHILDIEIPLPPLAEQQRIVAAIEAGLTRIDSGMNRILTARKHLSKLDEILLIKAVNGELVKPSYGNVEDLLSDLRARRESLAPKSRMSPTPVQLDGYRLPSGWQMVSLGEISYDWGYGTSTKCSYEAVGVPVLRIPNIVNGKADATSDIKHAVNAALDLSDLFLNPGDLLFVRTNGSLDLIGRVGIVDAPLDVAFASYLIRFRLVPDGVVPGWVRIVINSPIWRRHTVRSASSSAGQYNVNSKILASIPVPIPPKDEQLEIVSKLEQWQDRSSVLENASSLIGQRTRLLRDSILTHAFSGRLIRQDPSDDHA
jgi:type I restriction enzyme, S subunit